MDIKDKKKAITEHCKGRLCSKCILMGRKCKVTAFSTNDEIEENYRLIIKQQKQENLSSNMVDHPDHYKHGSFETIEEMLLLFSKEEVIAFCKINAYKYKARAPFKGNMEEDLKKADWYLAKVKELEGK